MANDYNAVSDGTYVLQQSNENPNQFYFYREDGGVLSDVDREPMDLYHAFIAKKMMDGEITGAVMNNICAQMSDDETTIRLTISGIGEDPTPRSRSNVNQKPSFFRRLFNKLFG